jgi:tetratricopeptide (TPR) repeat protein
VAAAFWVLPPWEAISKKLLVVPITPFPAFDGKVSTIEKILEKRHSTEMVEPVICNLQPVPGTLVENSWFSERKDLFFTDLVHAFLESKIVFDDLYRDYQQNKAVPFKRMDSWIGTDTKKGPLWNLKDSCHKLFRKPSAKISLSEYLFDWTLGSVFHEGMKLKEDAYQLEAYLPRYDKIETSKNASEIEEILREYRTIIDKATNNLNAEMESINTLFSKAVERLKELLINQTHNGLLIRFLLEHEQLVEKALGAKSLEYLIDSLYPRHPENAYCNAGKSYLKGGWFKQALHYFTKALEVNPQHAESKQLREDVQQKLSPGGKI